MSSRPEGGRVLVTCALPYVNNVPHIGNIVGSHLPADIFARFCRLSGIETLFIGGSDEHGTPIEVAAHRLGISPKELCDRYYEIHKEIYEWLGISYDNFSRTSLPIHHETTQEFFRRIYENGYIVEKVLRLPYCEKDRRFLPDRYVGGVCPRCGYAGARGDQCEHCSQLLNPDELEDPKCALCGTAPLFRETKHLFLKLDALQGALEEWIQERRGIWSDSVIRLALGWTREGLHPRSITRDIQWGVKVPLEGYEGKVFYVWFDAPIGYISSTKEWARREGDAEAWRRFWQDPQCRIYHFVGKDNIPFHTLFWPGMILANGEYQLPHQVAGLQYLNYEGDKISKSHGWGIFCENLPGAGLEADLWRFYLSFLIPEGGDTEWKWKEFAERVNRELVANLGNFVYRTLSFLQKNFEGRVPAPGPLGEKDREVLRMGKDFAEEYRRLLEGLRLRDGLRKVLELSDRGNRYFQEGEPWKAVREDRGRAATTLYVSANLCYDLAILLSPYLPRSASQIFQQLGVPAGTLQDVGEARVKPETGPIRAAPLFPKLDDPSLRHLREVTGRVTQYEELFGGGEVEIEAFGRVDLRIGEVLSSERGGEGGVLLQVQVGEERVEVPSPFPPSGEEAWVGRKVVLLLHPKPRILTVRGRDGKLLPIVPEREVSSGSRIR
jgi:methionyl-tRNA synthetase